MGTYDMEAAAFNILDNPLQVTDVGTLEQDKKRVRRRVTARGVCRIKLRVYAGHLSVTNLT